MRHPNASPAQEWVEHKNATRMECSDEIYFYHMHIHIHTHTHQSILQTISVRLSNISAGPPILKCLKQCSSIHTGWNRHNNERDIYLWPDSSEYTVFTAKELACIIQETTSDLWKRILKRGARYWWYGYMLANLSEWEVWERILHWNADM